MAMDVLAHNVLEQTVEFSEVAEHDVSAVIPGEALGVGNRRRQPPARCERSTNFQFLYPLSDSSRAAPSPHGPAPMIRILPGAFIARVVLASLVSAGGVSRAGQCVMGEDPSTSAPARK